MKFRVRSYLVGKSINKLPIYTHLMSFTHHGKSETISPFLPATVNPPVAALLPLRIGDSSSSGRLRDGRAASKHETAVRQLCRWHELERERELEAPARCGGGEAVERRQVLLCDMALRRAGAGSHGRARPVLGARAEGRAAGAAGPRLGRGARGRRPARGGHSPRRCARRPGGACRPAR